MANGQIFKKKEREETKEEEKERQEGKEEEEVNKEIVTIFLNIFTGF